ncbi:acetyl-CoA synthetase-like protein [Xylona heveae TC161]|uniref:Acetyl-CoA synthetase-like protein n=1 Tax=Xylona heveae (strain CBS 132557 / TC161) TaxID=1328760 RepID=A0A164ZHI7_XYLHT|nr:acetyl-CoA synthetase-like protein [Xylona heveae TC161]KZF19112.1 acetyl-CoA synthetase-like protein [Xylona heveae TC161]
MRDSRDPEHDRVQPNYFTCTLGQAALVNAANSTEFSTINELIDAYAEKFPLRPAVGFPVPPQVSETPEPWSYMVLTFCDLRNYTHFVANELEKFLPQFCRADNASNDTLPTVALFCPSSADFLLTWLALIRLGFSVLLIAPQCQPRAIASLCASCKVSCLFYDKIYEDAAKETLDFVVDDALRYLIQEIPFNGNVIKYYKHRSNNAQFRFQSQVSRYDIAYIHHTSGTSSDLPKPIPQTHHAAVGVLPSFSDKSSGATFSTTPLYHGGVADVFRSWSSAEMIWLFPGNELPITARNVLLSLRSAAKAVADGKGSKVAYFSSVPYVLQMLSNDDAGMEMLMAMDTVGVGGAALPSSVGNQLVQKKVRLISRFGSAECGFLLSSFRDFRNDDEWQYLRAGHGSELLQFEPQGNSLFELIIKKGWPHMAKTNRSDGSFATSDLFEKHHAIENAWRYHSRADSQLTLITGKKFDPAPIEADIASSALLDDVLVFGNGREYPGALLFLPKESASLSSTQLVDCIWPEIERINAGAQPHTRIAKGALVVLSPGHSAIPKSSKGTVLRAQAERQFEVNIERAYSHSGSSARAGTMGNIEDQDVQTALYTKVANIMGDKPSLSVDTDLFPIGVDSIACVQIRSYIQRVSLCLDWIHSKAKYLQDLLPGIEESLPLNIVYDCGTIDRLASYIIDRRHGLVKDNTHDDEQLMFQLVDEYGDFSCASTELGHHSRRDDNITRNGEVVILTGATGALGAHLLDAFRQMQNVSRIICLVRAKTPEKALERVNKNLEAHAKKRIDSSVTRISCIPTDLADTALGLSKPEYKELAETATLIVHAAWAVNFNARLSSFVHDHISGLHNLITLALAAQRPEPPRFIFCSSTASVSNSRPSTGIIPETLSHTPSSASPLGYSRSKWVAEKICHRAHENTSLRGRISVLRIGQLCGDTDKGIWNMSEAWPLMLSSVAVTGGLPAIDQPLDWLPLDTAAKAIVNISSSFSTGLSQSTEVPVFHIVNKHQHPRWSDLLAWLKKFGVVFEAFPPDEWVRRLEQGDEHTESSRRGSHPARKLLPLWKSLYAAPQHPEPRETPHFDTLCAEKISHTMRTVNPIDDEHFRRIWNWIETCPCSN